ncbi:photosystem II repair protein Psb32 [Kamptonema formosum]|uniref:photosystem II repair protein Psb32 n=1 Tax=Kamptonema formosum TaxID=331992 RepID=UPI000381E0C4|nr:TPM domain-containing protein [Oscillatoria sp. PCC 10802]
MHPILQQIFSRLRYHTRLILSIALVVLAASQFAPPAHATGVYQMPALKAGDSAWTIDFDDVLSRSTENQLDSVSEKLAEKTGNEVRFVTIHRLDYGETIDSFTNKLFETWFPTPEAQANQTLLVLDTLTNNSAIRTGEGVKSLMSDEIALSIATETLQAPLRQGNKYNQAFADASARLQAVLSGQPDPGPPQVADTLNVDSTFKSAEETDTGNSTAVVVVLLIAATVIPMLTYFWYQNFSG